MQSLSASLASTTKILPSLHHSSFLLFIYFFICLTAKEGDNETHWYFDISSAFTILPTQKLQMF